MVNIEQSLGYESLVGLVMLFEANIHNVQRRN